jgi:hypothetical protein
MYSTVAILDDEPDRLTAMVAILAEQFPVLRIATFDNAPEMVSWLEDHLQECALICLDHDLGPNRKRGEETFDPGIGRDVADWLATNDPVCPVIVHTTNTLAAPGMIAVLDEAGWKTDRVLPYDDIAWIGEAWIQAVHEALRVR